MFAVARKAEESDFSAARVKYKSVTESLAQISKPF